jgi:hypothetical protein
MEQISKFKALLSRATHDATPVEEARTSAMILAKLIVAEKWEPGSAGSSVEARAEIRKLATLLFQSRQTESNLRAQISKLESGASASASASASKSRVAERWLLTRFACQCRDCGKPMAKGTRVFWRRDETGSSVTCENCKSE